MLKSILYGRLLSVIMYPTVCPCLMHNSIKATFFPRPFDLDQRWSIWVLLCPLCSAKYICLAKSRSLQCRKTSTAHHISYVSQIRHRIKGAKEQRNAETNDSPASQDNHKETIFTQPEFVLGTSPRWTIQSISLPSTPGAWERNVYC
jgi:hypothetical protein